jgi:hypothetical protein
MKPKCSLGAKFAGLSVQVLSFPGSAPRRRESLVEEESTPTVPGCAPWRAVGADRCAFINMCALSKEQTIAVSPAQNCDLRALGFGGFRLRIRRVSRQNICSFSDAFHPAIRGDCLKILTC